jgi:hypothetical protein
MVSDNLLYPVMWRRKHNQFLKDCGFKTQLAVCLIANTWDSNSVQTAGSLSQCRHFTLSSNTWQSVSLQILGTLTQFKHLAVCRIANTWDSNSVQTPGSLSPCNQLAGCLSSNSWQSVSVQHLALWFHANSWHSDSVHTVSTLAQCPNTGQTSHICASLLQGYKQACLHMQGLRFWQCYYWWWQLLSNTVLCWVVSSYWHLIESEWIRLQGKAV